MKSRNIKNKIKHPKSPSNSRTITEYLKLSFHKLDSVMLLKIYRGSLKVFIVLIFILAMVIVGLDLDSNIRTKQSIDLERERLRKDLIFWEDFIKDQKNYRDAYFQASILEYKLGNTSKAKIYIEKGLSLDPNSKDGRKIEKLLEDK